MSLTSHPLWLVGFRPFFALACLAGASLPLAWVLMLAGVLPPPAGPLAPQRWHAHEMFFGFGWAVMGGFLLTASKNWVKVRGYHGGALMLLAAAWCIERVALACGADWPPALLHAASLAFLGTIVAMLLGTLLRHRARDSFRDNYFFVFALPAFLAAKLLVLDETHFETGVTMTLGLFRLAFLVMLERTLTQFMQNALQITLPRDARLDGAIKLLAAGLVFQGFMPVPLALPLQLALAVLLTLRFLRWRPGAGLRRLELAVMYLGYAALILQLLIEAAALSFAPTWVGSLSVHVFGLGAMGLIVPAMLIRISCGHTGRPVRFDAGDRAVLWIMLAALVLRTVLPQLAPQHYLLWLALAAGGWALAFAIVGLRYVPLLLRPRTDGKEH